MKSGSTFKLAIIIAVSLIITISIIVQRDHNKLRKEVASILKNGIPSTGVVVGKTYSSIGSNAIQILTSIIYDFKVKNDTVRSSMGQIAAEAISPNVGKEFRLASTDIEEGAKFLVLYDTSDPEKQSILCIDKPIHDSMDYNMYIKQIEENRNKQ